MQLRGDETALLREPKQKSPRTFVQRLFCLVHSERIELPTLWFEARCSIQLSYECMHYSLALSALHLNRNAIITSF